MSTVTTTTVPTSKKLMTLPSDQDATGRTLGEEEIASVTAAIRTGTLTSTKGEFVKTLEKKFAEQIGDGDPHLVGGVPVAHGDRGVLQ